MVKFTQDQMEVLSKFESNLRKAHFSRYCNALPKGAYDLIADTYEAAGGERIRRNYNCQTCLLTLLQKVGASYFDTKKAIAEETAALEAEAAILAELQEQASKTTTRSVKVAKTKRR